MLRFDFFMVPTAPLPATSPLSLFADNMFARIAGTINCPGLVGRRGSVAARLMQFYLLELNWPTAAIRCDPISQQNRKKRMGKTFCTAVAVK